jgi:hypothetical protein
MCYAHACLDDSDDMLHEAKRTICSTLAIVPGQPTTTHIILKVDYFQLIGRQLNGQWQLIEIEIEKQAPIN